MSQTISTLPPQDQPEALPATPNILEHHREDEPAAGSRDAVIEAVAGALGDAYDCGRTWAAWGVGTMGPDDFRLVAEDADRVAEIADAALAALDVEKVRNDGFSDGVLLALQVLNAGGDYMNAHYEELLNCTGERGLIERAVAEDLLELTGLGKLIQRRAECAAELRADLSDGAVAVLVHDQFKVEGWEPPSPKHAIFDELVEAGLMRRTDARCGFERMRDAWIKPTDAGVRARRTLIEAKLDQASLEVSNG